jgi:predicted helicase
VSLNLKPFSEYLHTVEKTLEAGHASEGSHYSALQTLIQSFDTNLTATVLPKQIECGAPDIIVTKGSLTIGYIEAKDIGKSLDEAEHTEQLQRYLHSLPNLILTDFIEFRWYTDGECHLKTQLGTVANDGKIKKNKNGPEEVAKLITEFLNFEAPGVGTAKELAQRMARLAHRIREGIEEALNKNIASDLLSSLYKAFQETLIPGLEVKAFADVYAQTIAYGLFAARCETDKADDFSRQKAASLIPKTNPFLRDLFYQITGPTLDDEPYKWAVDELVQILKKAEMAEIMKDFGRGTGKDDPVVYFYEDFLRAYDKKISEIRGVYYTPMQVVSYIVRSIDYILKNSFSRRQGLADEDIYILDPAAGTGTFLYTIINEICESMTKQGQMGGWEGYVAEHLLPRIFGFEFLMAPYVIAHFKLGLGLKKTGYEFQAKQRLGVYLTNSLEPALETHKMLMAPYLVREAEESGEVKKNKPIMVVLGNPPYSGISANPSIRVVLEPKTGKPRRELTWIGKLIEDYKVVDGQPLRERKHWLQDDYVKFIRFGQWRIKETGQGILGFITNHAYLDNPTFRGMRQSLMNNFTDIYILNLHGNVKRKEVAPDGGKDENVFDIQQGVAIGIFIKETGKESSGKIHYADLWGLREGKYQTLFEMDINDTEWMELTPTSPFYFFNPYEEELKPEYNKGWKVTEIFPVNSTGIVTARDEFVIDFEPSPIKKRIETFLDKNLSDVEVKEKLSLSENYMWRVSEARKQLIAVKDWKSLFNSVLYRPFDIRPIYYHPSVVWRTRSNVMHHMLARENLGLITVRQVAEGVFDHAFVSRSIVESRITLSNKGIGFLFPLYLYPAEGEMQFEGGKRRPNLNPEFVRAFSEKLGLKFVDDGKGNLRDTFGPEDVFNYAYAVFHSPTYRTRYAEFLKVDFPRLPLTSNKPLFQKLAGKGAELVSLHLMESPTLNNLITRYPVSGSSIVEKINYNETTKRVRINKEQYFEGVPPEVWNFHIGGYQVCQKWLKDRKGRKLTVDEAQHYQKIVVALKETIRLMAEVDALIPGWPIE